jgi:hypothetical protein
MSTDEPIYLSTKEACQLANLTAATLKTSERDGLLGRTTRVRDQRLWTLQHVERAKLIYQHRLARHGRTGTCPLQLVESRVLASRAAEHDEFDVTERLGGYRAAHLRAAGEAVTTEACQAPPVAEVAKAPGLISEAGPMKALRL